ARHPGRHGKADARGAGSARRDSHRRGGKAVAHPPGRRHPAVGDQPGRGSEAGQDSRGRGRGQRAPQGRRGRRAGHRADHHGDQGNRRGSGALLDRDSLHRGAQRHGHESPEQQGHLHPLRGNGRVVLAGRDPRDARRANGQRRQTGMSWKTIAVVAFATLSLSAYPSDRLPPCDSDNGGLTLPAGFCAVVVADQVGGARHLAVAANGDIFVALMGGRMGSGGVLALRDTNGDGKADVDAHFGTAGGTGIALSVGGVYFATRSTVLRYPTGIRNAVGLALAPDGRVWATQHGRDQLGQNWPKLFNDEQNAEKPSEELLQVNAGDDFGWPYCYHDLELGHLVLAPEYGGDGKQVGRCAQKQVPAAALPGQWAPNGLTLYAGTQFPARYRGGAFIAFHGSWNRAPLPQA